jgi:DNA-binding IclR family transcriptional regulator
MSRKASGAALIAQILAHFASEPPCNASALATRLGASRTTMFQAIARLEAAGFVERDARGIISPGPLSAKLGYATFGLARIASAVEALLPALRDDTEARAEFVVNAEGAPIVLAQRSPVGSPADAPGAKIIEARIASPVSAVVRLWLRAAAGERETSAARRSAQAVVDAISQKLDSPESRDHDERSLHDPRPCSALGREHRRLSRRKRRDTPKDAELADGELRRRSRRDA